MRDYCDVHYGLALFETDFIKLPDYYEALPYIDGEERYGDIICLNPDMSTGEYDDTLDSFGFAMVDLDKWPSLFSTQYKDYKTALAEIKHKVGALLPADFNYERRMIEYRGTMCG